MKKLFGDSLDPLWVVFVFFFVVVFLPFVTPHATTKILSTGKKRRVESIGDGDQES